MRMVLAAAVMMVASSVAGAALADDWPPASEYTYETICGQSKDEKQCRSNAATFTGYYNKAIKGDLVGQGMVAMALSRGMEGVAKRPSLACAWSHVILRSGHLLATPDDTKNNKYYCDSLSPEESILANAQALRMMEMFIQQK